MQTLRLSYLVPESKDVYKGNLQCLGTSAIFMLNLADELQYLSMCMHIVCAKGFQAEGILGH